MFLSDHLESCSHSGGEDPLCRLCNPVLKTAFFALKATNLVQLNEPGIKAAAEFIHGRLHAESYTPRTWRTHPLHLIPPEPYMPDDPKTRLFFDWIFVVSSLNFSFWSSFEGTQRYGVEWRAGWHQNDDKRVVHTGYWSLVAAIDRAMDEGIPIVDPRFYSSRTLCPDRLFEHIFRPAAQSKELMPMLSERIAILREVGQILCDRYNGSFQDFCYMFTADTGGRGTALQLVQRVVDSFPAFRDEHFWDGHFVYFWKRAQILVAEIWAACYPIEPSMTHPLFPQGAFINQLTMFADYRLPQILHFLRVLEYPSSLVRKIKYQEELKTGSREEVSIRAASIIGVEKIFQHIMALRRENSYMQTHVYNEQINCVLIDFFLWDAAKKLEEDSSCITYSHLESALPIHRTRSIWY